MGVASLFALTMLNQASLDPLRKPHCPPPPSFILCFPAHFYNLVPRPPYLESGGFLDCEGSGLYATQSACNHSCRPNAQSEFRPPHNNHTLTLVATQDIAAGEVRGAWA